MPKILIVEDEFNTRQGLSEILTEEGFEVALAEDGANALEKIDIDTDLLLSDLRLPDITGLDLFKKLKPLYPELVTIIMTAYSTPDLGEEAKDAGVFSWLTKPLNIEILLSKLQEALIFHKREKNKPMNCV
ncbi:MAG: response regulator [bacterium]